jgi:uncharacterized protein YllA (UPF0747 family)
MDDFTIYLLSLLFLAKEQEEPHEAPVLLYFFACSNYHDLLVVDSASPSQAPLSS